MFQDTCCITCVIGTIINVITVLVMRTLYIPGKLLREYSRGLVTVFSDNGQGSRKKHEARKPGQKRGVKQLILFNKVNLPLERVCFLVFFFVFFVFILSISIYCLFSFVPFYPFLFSHCIFKWEINQIFCRVDWSLTVDML